MARLKAFRWPRPVVLRTYTVDVRFDDIRSLKNRFLTRYSTLPLVILLIPLFPLPIIRAIISRSRLNEFPPHFVSSDARSMLSLPFYFHC